MYYINNINVILLGNMLLYKNNYVLKTSPRTTHSSSFRNDLTCLCDGNPDELVQSLLVQVRSLANINLLSTVCANIFMPS